MKKIALTLGLAAATIAASLAFAVGAVEGDVAEAGERAADAGEKSADRDQDVADEPALEPRVLLELAGGDGGAADQEHER